MFNSPFFVVFIIGRFFKSLIKEVFDKAIAIGDRDGNGQATASLDTRRLYPIPLTVGRYERTRTKKN